MPLPDLPFAGFFTLLESCLADRFVRRSSKLSPARLIGVLCLMTGFGRKGYRRVVAELRSGLATAFGWPALALVPSPQAIGQARQSLSRAMCDQAFTAVLHGCRAAELSPVVRYGGLRLLAIDGTRLGLPPTPALIEHFGVPKNHHGDCAAPMAGLVQVWDVGANRPIAFALTGCAFDERTTSISLFDRLGPHDLLIGDRGLPSYDLLRALGRRRSRFLLRCSIKANAEVMAFLASGTDDAIVRLIKRGPNGQRVDGTPAIPVRLIRTILPNGVVEVLATNLWRQRGHERQALIDLYTQRWRIETAFREMKVFHALETFSATYPDGIYQEIVAIQIFLLLTSELEAMARAEHHRRIELNKATAQPQEQAKTTNASQQTTATADHGVRFNRLIIADNVIHLLRANATGGPAAVAAMLPGILDYLWKNRSKPRLGRVYPRQRKRPARGYRKPGA
jgi:hypothetical protein